MVLEGVGVGGRGMIASGSDDWRKVNGEYSVVCCGSEVRGGGGADGGR